MIDSGRAIAEVARELGVNEGLLGRWVADERRRVEAAAARNDVPLTPAERTELARAAQAVRRAGAESRWSTFKYEHYYRHTFATKSKLVAAVDKWVRFYNNQRRHLVIGMLSPIAYEQSLDAATQVA
ncbi:hypothetical protein CIW52_04300 [Mycolicibacterium sp. P9-64]|nr:hypothetical protein CIW52_04300 [Mycolicibacterium sp. P9-64]